MANPSALLLAAALAAAPRPAAAEEPQTVIPTVPIPPSLLPSMDPSFLRLISACLSSIRPPAQGPPQAGTSYDFPPGWAEEAAIACRITPRANGVGLDYEVRVRMYQKYALSLDSRQDGGEEFHFGSMEGTRKAGVEARFKSCGPDLCGEVLEYSPGLGPRAVAVKYLPNAEGVLRAEGMHAEHNRRSLESVFAAREALRLGLARWRAQARSGLPPIPQSPRQDQGTTPPAPERRGR